MPCRVSVTVTGSLRVEVAGQEGDQAVERLVGTVALGGEHDLLAVGGAQGHDPEDARRVDGVLTGPADQLARELNSKRVVIDPAPAWLLGLLGGAAVAALAGRAASAIASMLPQSTRDRASALAQRARDRIDPFALLGFDPIELWQRLKHHYRP